MAEPPVAARSTLDLRVVLGRPQRLQCLTILSDHPVCSCESEKERNGTSKAFYEGLLGKHGYNELCYSGEIS